MYMEYIVLLHDKAILKLNVGANITLCAVRMQFLSPNLSHSDV